MSGAAAGLGPPVPGEVTAELTELASGVYAYLQSPGGWCLSNAGVLLDADGAVVIDTLATERRARALRAAVDRVSSGPRRLLVNTHHHGDHTFGNHLFGPQAQIVAHELAVGELAATGLALTHLWSEVDWGDVRVTPPTITFGDRLTLWPGGRRVELLHVGPAHTTNDVVVWPPDERVLFAGDVALSGCAPFVLMGSVAGTLRAIEELRRLEPATVVCGHGPPTGSEVLDTNAAYLRWVQEIAVQGDAAGWTPLETASRLGRSAFGELLDAERVVGNLHRAFAELPRDRELGHRAQELGHRAQGPGHRDRGPGHPEPDVLAAFAEMVTYNGGRLPTCLA